MAEDRDFIKAAKDAVHELEVTEGDLFTREELEEKIVGKGFTKAEAEMAIDKLITGGYIYVKHGTNLLTRQTRGDYSPAPGEELPDW